MSSDSASSKTPFLASFDITLIRAIIAIVLILAQVAPTVSFAQAPIENSVAGVQDFIDGDIATETSTGDITRDQEQ